jgi:hypothetical protein
MKGLKGLAAVLAFSGITAISGLAEPVKSGSLESIASQSQESISTIFSSSSTVLKIVSPKEGLTKEIRNLGTQDLVVNDERIVSSNGSKLTYLNLDGSDATRSDGSDIAAFRVPGGASNIDMNNSGVYTASSSILNIFDFESNLVKQVRNLGTQYLVVNDDRIVSSDGSNLTYLNPDGSDATRSDGSIIEEFHIHGGVKNLAIDDNYVYCSTSSMITVLDFEGNIINTIRGLGTQDLAACSYEKKLAPKLSKK